MTARVEFATENDLLIANVTGSWEKASDSLAAFSKIVAQAEGAGLYRVLYLSEVRGRIPTTLEGHFLGQRAAAIMEPLTLGYVSLLKGDEEMEESVRFAMQVATNRGLQGRIFATGAEARYWLSQQPIRRVMQR
ncbi:hypothetical protein [Blastopirellula retiformator]|uniref:STAS/SEC14 domain-containing protein n=1 Tax=Blastopirellula retiformator TaxID=2527970 RepID=A0A5C5VKW0_9BACT|nr:hypothetical protein [Blastopirellula retiformator]TWT38607.1 hypothetical protein Enr8_03000 [Blastopirellula retiformator]